MTAIASRLAAWVADLHYEDLPEDVRAASLLRILDYAGVCLAGVESALGASLRQFAAAFPGEGPRPAFAPVGLRATAETNAFINGTLASGLDFDDTHAETVIHPTSAAVSAVWARAERQAVSGRETLTAIAAGAELCCRIGIGAPGEFHRRGFHPTGIIAPFGAAAAVCRAGRLDAARTEAALGLAASMGAGIMQSWLDGTDSRFMHNGHAAWAGLVAAGLADAGMTGPAQGLEGGYGLFATHLHGEARITPERITAGLGTEWESRNVALKPYPTGHVTHSFIDAVLFVLRSGAVDAGQVAGITCFVADYMMPIVCEPAAEKRLPRNASSARVSLQHILAEAVVFGEIGARSFTADRLRDPRVQRLAAQVVCLVDPEAPPRGTYKGWVRLHLADGRSLDRVEAHNWGSAQKPLLASDVRAKFLRNAGGRLGAPRAERAAALLEGLDRTDDVAEAIAALSAA